MLDCDTPDWQPLLDLTAKVMEDFMWMFAVETTDRRRIQAYKHYWTRRYVHLDAKGRAYVYTMSGRYRQVEPTWLLGAATAPPSETSGAWLPGVSDAPPS